MLNRRTLRIKIMQTLFAYEQCKEANYLLSRDFIEDTFKPDLNSMEVQDKSVLNTKKRDSLSLFDKLFQGEEASTNDDVGAAAKEALSKYQSQTKKDFDFLKKNMVAEVERLNASYHSILTLIVALANVARGEKKSGLTCLTNHRIIKAIADNDELRRESLKENAGWDNRMDKVRTWFRDVVRSDKALAQFETTQDDEVETQKAILKHLVRKLILGDTMINDHFEEENIRWSEDRDVLKSLVEKTIKSFDPEAGTIGLQKLSLDWEDDKLFMDKMFSSAADIDPYYKDLIARNTRNWEVDRLPLTDRVILEMAIAELIGFPGIPVKVSINEYIELAKHYSTPKSRQFINGILDVIAKELKGEGRIKKSGKGLLDNK